MGIECPGPCPLNRSSGAVVQLSPIRPGRGRFGYNAFMARRSRIRRILKWTGLIACVLIVVAWGVSLRWFVEGSCVTRKYELVRGVVADGMLLANRIGLSSKTQMLGIHFPSRWDVYAANPGKYQFGFRWPSIARRGQRVYAVRLPLWLPLLVVGLPTAFLWYRDRRRHPPGHCRKCGYNLTWNESGICSECRVHYQEMLRTATPSIPGMVRKARKHIDVGFPQCQTCGYDLTGNESGVCPECGEPVECPA